MEFTNEDLKKAIEDGIFDNYNNTLVPPATVIRYFENWANSYTKKMTKSQIVMCKKLRDKTGIGIMHCKKALDFYNWNYALAFDNIHRFDNRKLRK